MFSRKLLTKRVGPTNRGVATEADKSAANACYPAANRRAVGLESGFGERETGYMAEKRVVDDYSAANRGAARAGTRMKANGGGVSGPIRGGVGHGEEI
jgi:hypothetical protein